MNSIMRGAIAVVVCVILGVFFFLPHPLFAQEWMTARSGNITVNYKPDSNLKRMERLLRRRYFVTDLPAEYGSAAYSSDERIALRLQAILSRVKGILGMYPVIPDLTVEICKDRRELAGEYERIFGTPGQFKSFYVHKLKTVIISEQDISDSVIAHEFAHAVVDYYFGTLPPTQVAELISVYVDTHLEN